MAYWRTIRKEKADIEYLDAKIAACFRARNTAIRENDQGHVTELDGQIARYRLGVLAHTRNLRELEAGHFPTSLMNW